jgi:hypothetical protein
MRGTLPQWMLTAGSVATLEPVIIARAFPFLQTKGYGFVDQSGDALGVSSQYRIVPSATGKPN